MGETSLESGQMVCLGIPGVEPSPSVPRKLISKMDLKNIGCDDGR
jgi:hypothetical protein